MVAHHYRCSICKAFRYLAKDESHIGYRLLSPAIEQRYVTSQPRNSQGEKQLSPVENLVIRHFPMTLVHQDMAD